MSEAFLMNLKKIVCFIEHSGTHLSRLYSHMQLKSGFIQCEKDFPYEERKERKSKVQATFGFRSGSLTL